MDRGQISGVTEEEILRFRGISFVPLFVVQCAPLVGNEMSVEHERVLNTMVTQTIALEVNGSGYVLYRGGRTKRTKVYDAYIRSVLGSPQRIYRFVTKAHKRIQYRLGKNQEQPVAIIITGNLEQALKQLGYTLQGSMGMQDTLAVARLTVNANGNVTRPTLLGL